MLLQTGTRVKRSAQGWGCEVNCPVGPPGPPGPKGPTGPSASAWQGKAIPGKYSNLLSHVKTTLRQIQIALKIESIYIRDTFPHYI